jgi:NAD+ synthase (glutamine-hydrolysing)
MNKYGFVRVGVGSPIVSVGNPRLNLVAIRDLLDKMKDCDIVVLPELCITGYTCADLFRQQLLLTETEQAIRDFGPMQKVSWSLWAHRSPWATSYSTVR